VAALARHRRVPRSQGREGADRHGRKDDGVVRDRGRRGPGHDCFFSAGVLVNDRFTRFVIARVVCRQLIEDAARRTPRYDQRDPVGPSRSASPYVRSAMAFEARVTPTVPQDLRSMHRQLRIRELDREV